MSLFVFKMFKFYSVCKLAEFQLRRTHFLLLKNLQLALWKPNNFALWKPNIFATLKISNLNSTNVSETRKVFVPPALLALSILGWLGFANNDEDKESELVTTLKRAVLCMQREQHDVAEQLLHVALRLAQQQQNQQGVLYTYDLMGNLAMDQYQLDKAEKLFISVMQMLLSNGVPDTDLKVIHISLKLARMAHLKAEEEKAELGYKWCLEKIENIKNENVDSQTLYGVIQDWYSQFLLDKGEVQTSLKHLKEAYKVCCGVKGKNDTQSMLLLNDLGITSWRAGDLKGAENFITEGIAIGKKLKDPFHLGVLHANMGLLYVQKGIFDIANKYCKEAWNLGRKYENTDSMEQANYCFEQIKQNLVK